MAYGAAGDPENLIQPNTLMPYDPSATMPMPPAPTLPMAGNGGMALPVAQAPELPGMLPTMDVAPTQPNPLQTFARMAQGALAGMQGQQNPVIRQELAQQALDQRRMALQQQQQMQMLQLEELRRSKAVAEQQLARQIKNDETNQAFKMFEMKSTIASTAMETGLKMNDPEAVAGALRMRRDLGFPGPKTDEDIQRLANDRIQLEILEKKGATYAAQALMGIESPGMPPEIKEMAKTPQGKAMLMSTYKINDPQEHLLKVQKQEEDLKAVQFKNDLEKEAFELAKKPQRSPVEEARLGAIQEFRGHNAKSDTFKLAMEYQKGGLPLELALPKAAREMAQAKDKDTNMDAVISDVQKNNPNMSRGQAVLVANNAMNAAKKGFEDQEVRLESMKQVVGQIEEYSKKVHLYDSLIGRAGQQVKASIGAIYGSDYARAVAGLERQLAYLGNIMRELGEKGVISDKDISRGTALINPSVWTMASATKDSIGELKAIIARGQGRLEVQKNAAFNPGTAAPAPPKSAKDPLGLFGGGAP